MPPDKSKVSAAVVLFADLLGFSHQVEIAKDEEDAMKLAFRLKRFAERFSEEGQSLDFYGKKYWAFSDSIVVVWYADSDAVAVMTEFDAHLFELSGIASAQVSTMQGEGQMVRGGIAKGWFLEANGVVVGDALVTAARLEKAIGMPFIAVEQELYDYYLEHHGRRTYHESIDPVRTLFIPPCAYTRNIPALDYLMIGLGDIDLTNLQISEARIIAPGDERDEFMSGCYRANVTEFIMWHKSFVVEGLKSADGKIVEKYEALRDHHNFRISTEYQNSPELLI